MVEKLTIDFSRTLPLLPQPGCVLLPHATIPLHIHESCYLRLVRHVLDSHGLIAMALVEDPHDTGSAPAFGPVRPYVCVSYVVRHQQLSNKRYNLLLQGICRARIVQEVDQQPYRTVLLEPTEPHTPLEIDLDEHRRRIELLLRDPLLKELASISAIHNWLSAEIPTAALIDLAIMTACDCIKKRYSMLAEPDVFARAKWLETLLRDTRQTLNIAERFRTDAATDGIYLN